MSLYYCGVLGVLLIYDIIRRIIFENIKKWFFEFREFVNFDIVVVFVGNKFDF